MSSRGQSEQSSFSNIAVSKDGGAKGSVCFSSSKQKVIMEKGSLHYNNTEVQTNNLTQRQKTLFGGSLKFTPDVGSTPEDRME